MISAEVLQTNILAQFGGATPPEPPQMDPPKSIFLNGPSLGASVL